MAVSDSMFLIEIAVGELRSLADCKQFLIKSHFADVFSVLLKNPHALENTPPKKRAKKRKKTKLRGFMAREEPKSASSQRAPVGQSVVFAYNLMNLITNMSHYPMELSLWSRVFPDFKIASTTVRWRTNFVDYLKRIQDNEAPPPATMTGYYNIFDEYTSRRMAVIKLHMTLSFYSNNIQSPLPCLPGDIKRSDTDSSRARRPFLLKEDIGVIKTTYAGRKFRLHGRSHAQRQFHSRQSQSPDSSPTDPEGLKDETEISTSSSQYVKRKANARKCNQESKKTQNKIEFKNLVKSNTGLDTEKPLSPTLDLSKPQSCSSINKQNMNVLNYILNENRFGDQVYCVGYCTVENDGSGSQPSPVFSTNSEKAATSETSKGHYHFRLCDDECENMSKISIDIPKDVKPEVITCTEVDCHHRTYRELPPPPDDRILLDLTSLKKDCCQKEEKIEQVVGAMKMRLKGAPCYCECECEFGFMKTTYCKVCGGYEKVGDEIAKVKPEEMPFPCPIYHNLPDRPKPIPNSASEAKRGGRKSAGAAKNSDAKKNIESERDSKKKAGSDKGSKGKSGGSDKGSKSTPISDKDPKDCREALKKLANKFKFNYGYQGIPPHIGHDYCASPCTGTLDPVPKKMGWLWNAEDMPGLKFRPAWRPGAINKHVLRLLRMAKNPNQRTFFVKKKKRVESKKETITQPLITVHKKDGEYTVTMETMKTYSKPRAINQPPYEDKSPQVYTIGRTEEENQLRRRKKERVQRRLERAERDFIQSAFRDMCQEICLKTYQQALGILPDAETSDCTCYPTHPGSDRTDVNRSCSCSDDSDISCTDSDEWIIEFTPPVALYKPDAKCEKVCKTDAATQYTYLDYRVKLLDRYGNPVPRFFIGPDGKQQCSDLGGFWGPDGKWLEINVDGYIGPDGRWAPNVFIGPNGETIDGESGKFQAADGRWLVVGIDGYIDANGVWRFYPQKKVPSLHVQDKKERPKDTKKDKQLMRSGKDTKGDKQLMRSGKDTKGDKVDKFKSDTKLSCFGDASPKLLSELGIVGHGHNRKLLLDTLNQLIAQGQDIKIPKPSSIARSQSKKRKPTPQEGFIEQIKCSHAVPSNKGVLSVDSEGKKKYFSLRPLDNKRPKQRVASLAHQGISLSSFHGPCFESFIGTQMMEKQQYERLVELAKKRGYYDQFQRKAEEREARKRYRNAV